MPPDNARASGQPAVTVAVVVKDRVKLMAECLDALAAQDHDCYDVLVVDNGSTDGTLQMLQRRAESFPVPLTVVEVAGPLGRARQAAAELATGDIIAFTDSDCVPDRSWLRELTAELKHERVDVVQGRTEPAAEQTDSWPRTVRVTAWSDLYETCNIAYRRRRLLEAGGFPTDAGHYGAEDTTAGWRVRRLGGEHRFAADAVVHHEISYPGVRWHLRFARSFATFPELVSQFPEMRSQLLTGRVFLRPRSAAFDGAVLGAALVAIGQPAGVVLAAPYLRHVWKAWREDRTRGVTRAVAYDAVSAAHLVKGSVRTACLVL